MTDTPGDDLPCRELVDLATDHLEGALDPGTEQRVREHLATCEGCADYVDQLRATSALAAALPAETLSAGLRARLLAAFRHRA